MLHPRAKPGRGQVATGWWEWKRAARTRFLACSTRAPSASLSPCAPHTHTHTHTHTPQGRQTHRKADKPLRESERAAAPGVEREVWEVQ
eukprot:3141113-Rhodomonas_salina.2